MIQTLRKWGSVGTVILITLIFLYHFGMFDFGRVEIENRASQSIAWLRVQYSEGISISPTSRQGKSGHDFPGKIAPTGWEDSRDLINERPSS